MAPLTGRKVLAIAVACFGLVIAVNVAMAYKAVESFPGLEEETGNGYDESQAFDQIMKAQRALGWKVDLGYAGREFRVEFEGKDGAVPQVAGLDLLIGRPTEAKDDQRPVFTQRGPVFTAPLTLAPGRWMVKVDARAKDGTEFHQRLTLVVAE